MTELREALTSAGKLLNEAWFKKLMLQQRPWQAKSHLHLRMEHFKLLKALRLLLRQSRIDRTRSELQVGAECGSCRKNDWKVLRGNALLR